MPTINLFKNTQIETQRGLVNSNPHTSDSKAYCVLCHVDLDKMDVWGVQRGLIEVLKKIQMGDE